MEATLDGASEMTLITRYTLSALQLLLDNDDSKTRLEFAYSDPANIDERSPIFNGFPDFTITVFTLQTNDGVNVGCGEVKCFSRVGSYFLVNWGFVRLALFGKRTMDKHNLTNTLCIHIVGKFVLEKKK